jgi:uncharacterized protein (TIGR03435 family)
MTNPLVEKRVFGAAGWVVVAVLVVGLVVRPAVAQAARDITGTWQGTLPKGKGQRIVVKIAKNGAGWRGVVYNLDSDRAFDGWATTQMSLQGAELRFAIATIDASYEGKLTEDGKTVAGSWTASGKPFSLALARANGGAEWEIPSASKPMAKDADPDWEAATVRPSDPNDTNSGFHLDGRRIFIERETVESMLVLGYGMHKRQIVGAPDWAVNERWDVKGVPDLPGQPGLKQFQGMVRKVLAERFGFQSHTDTRELTAYVLMVGKGGAKLAKSAGDPNGPMNESDQGNSGQRTLEVTNASLSDFALVMKFFLDRPMVDQTGLAGKYDFRLKWTFDEAKAPTDGSAAPSVFTAIEEQMGLKLELAKAPTEVLVVDKVERPSAN